MDDIALKNELAGIRKDLEALTRAVLTVAAVVAEQGATLPNVQIKSTLDGRDLVARCFRSVTL